MPRIRQLADKYAMKDLGSHIKGRIEASGRTQQEIGETLDLSQQSVSRLLNNPGRITVATLRKIAKVVELDQDVILKTFDLLK